MIKPRTTYNNRNEFNVMIAKTAGVDIADMSLFPKPVVAEAQQTTLADLRAEIESMKKEREEEQAALKALEQEEKEAQSKKRE